MWKAEKEEIITEVGIEDDGTLINLRVPASTTAILLTYKATMINKIVYDRPLHVESDDRVYHYLLGDNRILASVYNPHSLEVGDVVHGRIIWSDDEKRP